MNGMNFFLKVLVSRMSSSLFNALINFACAEGFFSIQPRTTMGQLYHCGCQ